MKKPLLFLVNLIVMIFLPFSYDLLYSRQNCLKIISLSIKANNQLILHNGEVNFKLEIEPETIKNNEFPVNCLKLFALNYF